MRSLEEKKEATRKNRFKNYQQSCRLEGFTTKSGHRLVANKFVLGEYYYLSWFGRPPVACQFIQVTKCGYNFLNLETHQCVLKSHLYVPKKMRDKYSGPQKFLYTLEQLRFMSHEEAKAWTIAYYKRQGKGSTND